MDHLEFERPKAWLMGCPPARFRAQLEHNHAHYPRLCKLQI